MKYRNKQTERKKQRVRSKIKVLTKLPRLSVFRSNKYIYAQIIDRGGRVLAAANDLKIEAKAKQTERANQVGREIGQKALKANIRRVAFDRGAYKYHGRVKALAEGARKAGLKL